MTTADAPRGPTPAATGRPAEEEARAGAFGQHTRLPLEKCRYTVQEALPHRARSALPRLFPPHGIRPRPAPERAEKKQTLQHYPIGSLPVEFAEMHPQPGRGYLLVAIDFRQQGGLGRVAAPGAEKAGRCFSAPGAGGHPLQGA